MTHVFGKPGRFRDGLQIWKFALFAGLAFTAPYFALAFWLGPVFPSLAGALLGLGIVVPAARKGFLLRNVPLWDFPEPDLWDSHWVGAIKQPTEAGESRMNLFRAWLPYVLVAGLLVVTRWPGSPVKEWLSSVAITWTQIFGTNPSASIPILYLPGTVFLVVSISMLWLQRMSVRQLASAWQDSLRLLAKPALALVFAVALVRVFIESGQNDANLQSMPLVLAETMADWAGMSWPFFAPFVGAMGAFVAGSNTVSDMMFAMFQYGVAERTGTPHLIILGLQAFGGAAGNMITVHNVVAASATVGLVGVEGMLIRKTFLPMLFYLLTGGVMGVVLTYILFPHVF
jgi:lactate permease